MPTFSPPTPPVLVPPQNPFGLPLAEPKAPAEEKKDDPPEPEAPASEKALPAEPGMYLDSL